MRSVKRFAGARTDMRRLHAWQAIEVRSRGCVCTVKTQHHTERIAVREGNDAERALQAAEQYAAGMEWTGRWYAGTLADGAYVFVNVPEHMSGRAGSDPAFTIDDGKRL